MKKLTLALLAATLILCTGARRWVPPRFIATGSAVDYVSKTTATTSSGSSLSFNHTVSSTMTDGCVVVSVFSNYAAAGGGALTATYDGVSMTRLLDSAVFGGQRKLSVFVLPVGNKAPGTYTVVVTATQTITSLLASLSTYNYVHQTTPTGTAVGGTPSFAGSSTLTPSSAVNDMAYMAFGSQGQVLTAGAGQTDIYTNGASSTTLADSYKLATTPTTTMSYTAGASNNRVSYAFAIKFH